MLTEILKKIGELCSLKTSQGADRNKWKGGFTLVELMVVIVIVNLLSGVAIPKITDVIEKTKQRIDLMKLYYLRDSLNRALYEDQVTNIQEGKQGQDCDTVTTDKLTRWLTTKEGVALFIIELNVTMPASYQGLHGSANKQNLCGLMYSGGFWNNALKDAGFGAVADIVADRDAHKNYGNYKPTTYTAVKNTADPRYYRTFPNTPLFKSRFLNGDPRATGKDNTRIVVKFTWTGLNPDSHSLEVFMGLNAATNESALLSRQGTCFSTIGASGCKKSTPR